MLEHLKDPERLLKQISPVLRRDGSIVVSVPNVANIFVRLSLLFGRFEYTERGILDKTHLRFFTRKSARALVRKLGFRILAERATVIPFELAIGKPATHPLMIGVNRLLKFLTGIMPGLFGYQIMFLLQPETNGKERYSEGAVSAERS